MNGPTLVAIGIIVGVVVSLVVAFLTSGRVVAIIQSRFVRFAIQTKARVRASQEFSPLSPEERIRASQDARPWSSRNWCAVLTLSFILISTVASSWWWFSQPGLWRTLASGRLSEVAGLLLQGSRNPLVINTEEQTLHDLRRAIEGLIAKLQYGQQEMWVVDHYWRYWLSDSLDEYLRVNNEFVQRGGTIHRMLVIDEKDLGDPRLKDMLLRQCAIARPAGSNLIKSNFDLWLARRLDIQRSAEYNAVAGQFSILYSPEAKFEEFDVVQFSDALYFSNSFSDSSENNDPKEKLGSSKWAFQHTENVHLESLFKVTVPGAEQFNCKPFQRSFEHFLRK